MNEDLVFHARDVICIQKEKGMAMMKITTIDDTISVKGNLNDMESQLIANHFIQVNRACFVNMAHIRKFSGKLDGYYRVSVGTKEQNQKFLEAFKSIM